MLGKHHIGNSVHTASMWAGDTQPQANRDRLKNTNNMWSYPEHLDAHGPVKAHIDMNAKKDEPAPPEEKTEKTKEKEAEAKKSLA